VSRVCIEFVTEYLKIEDLHDLYSKHTQTIVWVITIERNEMGGTCNSDGGEDRRVQGYGGETCGIETNGEIQT
jgi:hypothetical protein